MVPGHDRCYVGLVHHPVYNKRGEVITTTITNLDLHDISRTVRTYGLKRYYVINPLRAQQAMVRRMVEYWCQGLGSEYNYSRHQAFETLAIKSDLSEVIGDITRETSRNPEIIVTDARVYPRTVSYPQMRTKLRRDEQPFLLLFGTGWGLARELIMDADHILEPIRGLGNYNHLSVRSAAAIIIDRLFCESWWDD